MTTDLKASTEAFLPETMLEDTLQQDIEQEHHLKTLSKELFSKHNIRLKTDVSHNEINHITKLLFLQDKLLVSNVEGLIDAFLQLRVSKQRQSRKEFVEALQLENRKAQGAGFGATLGKILGRDQNP